MARATPITSSALSSRQNYAKIIPCIEALCAGADAARRRAPVRRNRWTSMPTGNIFAANTSRTPTARGWSRIAICPKKYSRWSSICAPGPSTKDWGTDIYDDDKKLGRPLQLGIQYRRDLQGRPQHLARLRQAADHRRAPADGDQLCRDWRDRDQLAFPETPVSTA